MITYRVDYDEAVWLPIPEEPDDTWPDVVIAHYERVLGVLPAGLQDALRFLAAQSASLRTTETGQLLLFCPPPLAPAVGVVGIEVTEAPETVDLVRAVVVDPEALLTPAVESIPSDYWGEGRRAAIVTPSSTEGVGGGRFTYAFQRGDTLLLASAVADEIPAASTMLPFANRLVTSVRLEDDE